MSTNILLFALYCHVLPILCIDMNNSVYRVISMKPANASILRKINRKLVFGLIFFCSLSVLLLFYYKPDTSPDTDNQSAPVPEIVPDTSETNDTSSKYIITLDPGHGGYDPGKIGVDGSQEKNINLRITLALKQKLTDMGFVVYMTREDDSSLNTKATGTMKTSDLNHRIQIVAEHQSDLFISIHQNSFTDPSVHGAQVFYLTDSKQGKLLAESIHGSIQSNIDPDNERPVKGNAEYMILKKSPCPAVIVECGFLSNPDECKALTSADYQDAMAAAIAEGIWYFITEYGDTLTE